MQNVLLIVHLLIAICLIATVLLQRSEGGALGIGGGGGGGISSRGRTSGIAKLTWGLATAFLATSITLAILAGDDPGGRSVIDGLGTPGGGGDGIILPDLPAAPDSGATVPPAADPEALPLPGDSATGGGGGGSAPVAPPTAD